jgi:hypothetical protein
VDYKTRGYNYTIWSQTGTHPLAMWRRCHKSFDEHFDWGKPELIFGEVTATQNHDPLHWRHHLLETMEHDGTYKGIYDPFLIGLLAFRPYLIIVPKMAGHNGMYRPFLIEISF